MSQHWIIAETLGASDCFDDVSNDSASPAPDFIAEDAKAAEAAATDWAFDRDPPRRSVRVRYGP